MMCNTSSATAFWGVGEAGTSYDTVSETMCMMLKSKELERFFFNKMVFTQFLILLLFLANVLGNHSMYVLGYVICRQSVRV